MEAIVEFFNRPEVVQFCYGLLAALPPSLASICSIVVVPIVKKIIASLMDDLHGKESELDRKMTELADAVRNGQIAYAEAMTAITKVQHEIEEVKRDGEQRHDAV